MKLYGFPQHYTFSRKERYGVVVFICLILAFIAGTKIFEFYYSNLQTQLSITTLLYQDSVSIDTITKGSIYTKKDFPQTEKVFLSFDLNEANYRQLCSIGLNGKQANTILNYRDKAGVFKAVSQLKKIYGIDSITLQKISPFLYVADSVKTINKQNTANNFQISINSATAIELQKLHGVGKVLSSRIIKYRDLLGGYYSIDQLYEVYGLSDSIIQNISEHIKIDTSTIRKLQFKNNTDKDLAKHPYISNYTAKAILKYYSWKKDSTIHKSDFVTNGILTEEEYLIISPYLP